MALKLIISPAKKMRTVDGEPAATSRPIFLDEASRLADELGGLSYKQAKALWRTSDALTGENYDRTRTLSRDMQAEPAALTAAIVAYEGIQYKHIAPDVMDSRQLEWIGRSLRIVSGLYGLLRPFDGVTPYRLEMQAPLSVGGARNLYEYWDSRPYDALCSERDATAIVNLASVEYAKAVLPHALPDGPPVVTCIFGSVRQADGKLVQRATEAKAARGTFVRWCAERGVQEVQELSSFAERNYSFDEARSDDQTLVFVRPWPGSPAARHDARRPGAMPGSPARRPGTRPTRPAGR
ncbi:MAG: peroxide stress protein YaaA [Olsenella sp.]|nr:peroxide stress protein YaaA [Olsenella sp.]